MIKYMEAAPSLIAFCWQMWTPFIVPSKKGKLKHVYKEGISEHDPEMSVFYGPMLI